MWSLKASRGALRHEGASSVDRDEARRMERDAAGPTRLPNPRAGRDSSRTMRNGLALLLFGSTSFLAATAAAQPAPPPPPVTTAAQPPGTPPPTATPPAPGQPSSDQPAPDPAAPPPNQTPPPPGQAFPPPGQMPPPSGQMPAPSGTVGALPMSPSPGWQGPQQWPGAPQQPFARPEQLVPEALPGVVKGVPMSRRGRIAVDAAGFTQESGDASLLALALDMHFPVATRTFIDARLPMSGIYPGNIMLGAGRVSKLGRGGFISYGAQIGIPLVTNRNADDFSLPHGTWNVHEYEAHAMPIKLGLGYERATRYLEIRVDLEPVFLIPVGDNDRDFDFAFQHAAELQIGHSIGGGLRAQGVAVTAGVFPDFGGDAYQFALEPFFVVRRDLGFARIGLMMPIDDSVAGPAFVQAWGLRLMTGLHID